MVARQTRIVNSFYNKHLGRWDRMHYCRNGSALMLVQKAEVESMDQQLT
jgi:hypothetical protein